MQMHPQDTETQNPKNGDSSKGGQKAGKHIPVLLTEAVTYLAPKAGRMYVDATFGGGGYTRALLEASACRVVGIDRDPQAQQRSLSLERDYSGRFQFALSTFSAWDGVVDACPWKEDFAGIVFDFGVSSFQLDEGERGFSFQKEGPLDMRMGATGLTAAEVVNTFSEGDLYQVIKTYGEERFAGRIAKAILRNRPLVTTLDLARVIHEVVPWTGGIDSATKTFQALRIFVNDELKEIDAALRKVVEFVRERSLGPVRVVTVAFHSLEDGIVKNWIRNLGGESGLSVTCLTRKVVVPGQEELSSNPRSHSARLRAVELVLEKS